MQFYLVGIKGSGMSALANILIDLGHEVFGVDYPKKYFTEDTLPKSIVRETFETAIIKKEYFYVIGNAFKLSNFTQKIIEMGYEYMHYPEFLETFFKMKKIGICGSHGKTTTTCFASSLIDVPLNVLIGDGTGSGNLESKYFLFEACEYQNNFLKYTYDYLVMLNVDYDHPDFFKSENDYLFSFQKAALNAKILIINNDDKNCQKIVHNNKITFGFNKESDVVITYSNDQLILAFYDEKFSIDFPFVGQHLAYDFTASFILAYMVNSNRQKIQEKAKNLYLPRRRLTEYKIGSNVLVNDYAHHPTEIKAVFQTLSLKYPEKKKIAIYQPHTFSRTDAFLNQYITSLKLFDEVYVLPIFSSVRETDIDKFLLLNSDFTFLEYDKNIKHKLLNSENNVIAFIGAGDIDTEFYFFIN